MPWLCTFLSMATVCHLDLSILTFFVTYLSSRFELNICFGMDLPTLHARNTLVASKSFVVSRRHNIARSPLWNRTVMCHRYITLPGTPREGNWNSHGAQDMPSSNLLSLTTSPPLLKSETSSLIPMPALISTCHCCCSRGFSLPWLARLSGASDLTKAAQNNTQE